MTLEVRLNCPYCDWRYQEVVVESAIPAGLLAAFSDPEGLVEILQHQRIERIAAAVVAHCREAHPHLARVQ